MFPDDFLLQLSKSRCQNIDRPVRNSHFRIRSKRGNDKPLSPLILNKICQIRGEWVWFRFDSDGTQYDLTCRKISRDTELKRINTNSTIDLDSNENDL